MAQVIVNDKTQLLYKWIFQYVKDITNISPKVFIMDSDLTVNGVILT